VIPGVTVPLDRTELLTGLVAGGVAVALRLLVSVGSRARARAGWEWGGAGLLFAGATLVGLHVTHEVPGGLVGGAALAAVGAAIAGGAVKGGAVKGDAAARLAQPAAVVPGAWVVAAHGAIPGEPWVRVLVFATIVAGSALVADLDRRTARLGVGPVLLAVSVGGVYATVPDTEQALVLLGVAGPVALLGWPLRRAGLGRAGSAAAVSVLAWTAAVGGVGRPSSIVGAVACLGLFVVGPLIRRPDRFRAPTMVAAHAVLVLISARVAGLRPTVRAAVTVVLLELVVAVAVCGVSRRRP
jgi:hypothetical protein